MQVSPGQEPPTDGSWHTLYFLPGLHDIGIDYRLQANRSYYIPGDAVVFGTLTSMDGEAGFGVKIFGHGTLSGDRLPHPSYSDTPQAEWNTLIGRYFQILCSDWLNLTMLAPRSMP